MTSFLASLLAAPTALGLIVKVTLLLAGGFAIASAFRRRSAAARHFVWVLVLSGSVALALLTPIVPRLRVGAFTLPSAFATTTGIRHAAALEPSFPRVPRPVGRSESQKRGTAAGERDAPAPVGSNAVSPAGVGSWTILRTLVVAWFTGFAAVLLWTLIGHLGLTRILRSASSVDAGGSAVWTSDPRAMGRTRRAARLHVSASVGGPLTWGWIRPVILLPREAEAWPAERRNAVLRHELAHVARADYLAQLIATLACALYWFLPLTWLAAWRLRRESEHACDDLVLASGTAASDYATSLLEVARRSRAMRIAGNVAVGMARPSLLEGRLIAVLDERRARGAFSARATILTAIASCAFVLIYAGLEPRVVSADAARSITRVRSANALAVPGARPVVSDRARPEATFDREFMAAAGELLDLRLDTGAEIVIHGWDRPSVRVSGQLNGPDWRGTRVTAERAPNGVLLRTEQVSGKSSYSTSHSFDVHVPSHYDVRLSSSGGAVTVVDLEGTLEGHTGGGQIVLENDRGRARLSTGGGEIRVSNCYLDGSVSTGGGTVTLSAVKGNLKGSSGSGPVIYADGRGVSDGEVLKADLKGIRVDGSGERVDVERGQHPGLIHIRKAGGEIDLAGAPDGAQVSTGGGDIHIGRSAGRIAAITGGGDVEIGPVAGSVRVGTGAGDVHITLTDSRGAAQDVNVTTGSGKVVVELPANLDARFELETAYTESFHRRTRITSAWRLAQEETSDWDAREGTPRRYVRAHGVAGQGRGLIRVHAVNGDIEVRRAGVEL